MISAAPTRIISWLKQPRSLIANVGIGVGALAIVATPVAAVALTTSNDEPKVTQSSTVTAESTEKSQNHELEGAKNDPVTNETEQDSTNNATQSTQSSTNNAAQPTQTTQAVPAAPVYADSYPADLKGAPVSSKIDQWGMNNRQSTSYTAWKVSESGATMPKWGYTGKGDAKYWLDNATASSIAQGTTPKVHSVAVRTSGGTGFTAWVEAIDGDNVIITSYNFDNTGEFKQMSVPASYFNGYIYF